MKPRILVIGCASRDRLHIGGCTYDTIGGAGLYTALAARLLGADVTLLAPRPVTVPLPFQPVEARLRWTGPLIAEDDMPHLEIAHYGGGKAQLLGASWGGEGRLAPDLLPDDLSSYSFVHIAALSSAQKMLQFLHACRERRAPRISAGTYFRIVQQETATVRAIFEQADLFFMNENEALGLWGSLRVAGRISTRTRDGALLFITFDRRGAIVVEGDRATPIPAERAQELDPTGAGDTFCGATLAGLAQGKSPLAAAQDAAVIAARKIEHVGPAYLLSGEALTARSLRRDADAI